MILCLIPVILVNAIPQSAFENLPGWSKATDVVGLALWVTGFVFECTADWQKSRWLGQRMKKLHDEEFMTRGLFGRR